MSETPRTSGKTHPHVDSPTEDQLREIVAQRPEELIEVYVAMHKLVVATLPDLLASVDLTDAQIGYGARQYGYDGWGMAAVVPYSKWVSISFTKATSLDDPDGLFEGTGSTIRHVKVRSLDQLAQIQGRLIELLRAAVSLNA